MSQHCHAALPGMPPTRCRPGVDTTHSMLVLMLLLLLSLLLRPYHRLSVPGRARSFAAKWSLRSCQVWKTTWLPCNSAGRGRGGPLRQLLQALGGTPGHHTESTLTQSSTAESAAIRGGRCVQDFSLCAPGCRPQQLCHSSVGGNSMVDEAL